LPFPNLPEGLKHVESAANPQARVANLFVRNSFRWFGLFEGPFAAHDNYAQNKDVLRVMFEKPRK
jgi:hypothetical protein